MLQNSVLLFTDSLSNRCWIWLRSVGSEICSVRLMILSEPPSSTSAGHFQLPRRQAELVRKLFADFVEVQCGNLMLGEQDIAHRVLEVRARFMSQDFELPAIEVLALA